MNIIKEGATSSSSMVNNCMGTRATKKREEKQLIKRQ